MLSKYFKRFIIISIFFLPSILFSQDLEKLAWLLEENKIDEIEEQLPVAIEKYPDEPLVLYLRAMLEPDAKKAVRLYEAIFEKHRRSEYADDALLKIAHYYYARELCGSARKYFKFLARRYPHSPNAPEALYMAAQCLIVEGKIDTAKAELVKFIRKNPESVFVDAAIHDLELSYSEKESPDTRAKVKEILPAKVAARYTIQVGAFRNQDNAIRQNQDLRKLGYDCFVKKRKRKRGVFFIVYLGKFATKKEAEDFGGKFYDKYGIPYRVVKREESD